MKGRLPGGVRDYLPDEAENRDQSLLAIESVFKSAGYDKVITPTLEFYKELKHALSPQIRNSTITFKNDNGAILALRPDPTASLARIVATRLQDESGPLDLYYLATVFRDSPGETESFQAGIESISDDSPEADAKVISTTVQALSALGIDSITVALGDQSWHKDKSEAEQDALLSRCYTELNETPKKGGAELAADSPRLSAVSELLTEKNISFCIDRGLYKDPDYYTGITFDILIEGLGQPIASGGRYNDLISKFGIDRAAVGAAIYLNRLPKGDIA